MQSRMGSRTRGGPTLLSVHVLGVASCIEHCHRPATSRWRRKVRLWSDGYDDQDSLG